MHTVLRCLWFFFLPGRKHLQYDVLTLWRWNMPSISRRATSVIRRELINGHLASHLTMLCTVNGASLESWQSSRLTCIQMFGMHGPCAMARVTSWRPLHPSWSIQFYGNVHDCVCFLPCIQPNITDISFILPTGNISDFDASYVVHITRKEDSILASILSPDHSVLIVT